MLEPSKAEIAFAFELLAQALKAYGPLPTRQGKPRKADPAEFMYMQRDPSSGTFLFKHADTRNYVYVSPTGKLEIPTGGSFRQGVFDVFEARDRTIRRTSDQMQAEQVGSILDLALGARGPSPSQKRELAAQVLGTEEAADLYTRMITSPGGDADSLDMQRLRRLSGIEDHVVQEDDGVGRTIADQMGGAGKLKMMLGATVVLIPNGLAIKWPNKHKSKGDLVEITLEPSDTYTMRFYNTSRGQKKLVKEFEDVYFDQLVDIFEQHTGWYLRMGGR